MSQAASSQMTQEMSELKEEILFQKVLLQSIDDHVLDREAAEQEVRDEIHSLERRFKQLKRATKASSSSSSKPSSQQFQSTPEQPTNSARRFQEHLEMNGYLASEQWNSQSASAVPSNASSSSVIDTLGGLVSPSKMDLPTRKRSHSTHLDGQLAPIDNKCRRTSLSPFGTGPPTPSTSGSSDDKFDAFDRNFYQMQQDEESRLERERMDEEYARSLQDGFNAPQMNAPSGSMGSMGSMQPPARNAFDRMSGAHHQPYVNPYSTSPSGQHRNGMNPGRTLPWGAPPPPYNSSVKGEPQSMHSGVKQERPGFAPFSSYTSSPPGQDPFKREPASRPMPGSFQDDSSTASDSEIEIIPASAFRDNGRHVQTKMERTGFAPGSSRSSGSSDALQQALFGKQPKHEWMNGAQSGMNGDFVYPQQQGQKIDLTDPFSMDDMPIFMGSGPAHMGNPNPDLADIIARAGNDNNYSELSEYLNLDQQRMDQLGYVMNDPRKNAEEIQALLENIQPDAEIAPEDREGTPEALVYKLYEHQKIALAWMKAMEQGTNKGGILADDMGLGKTISALALIHSRPSEDHARKTTLIVGPVALVRQWDRELYNKTLPRFRLSTHIVHGSGRKLSWDELRTFDVVFTTYGTLAAEYKRLTKLRDKMKQDGIIHQDHNDMKKTFPLLGPRSTFYRILLDEAQCIKNKSTGAARACCSLRATYRFCLTGTPMMNNVGELYSLIHFLRIKPYNEWTRFQAMFGCLTKPDPSKSRQRDANDAMRKLQVLLKAILLRRTKKSTIDGKPIITLPEKTEEIQHVVFDDDEKAFYTALESKTQLQFNKYMKAGTVGKNYTNVLVLLLRLRQACCHPHLIQDFEEAPPVDADNANAMMELARSLAPDVVARILGADDAFECPVCYDVVVNPRLITPCGHDTCTECMTRISDQAEQQNVAEGQDGGNHLKCPSCRGPLSMDKVIDYAVFKSVHNADPQAEAEDAGSETESDSDDDSETDLEDDEDDDGDLRGFVVPDDIEDTDGEEDDHDADDDEAEVAPKKSKSKGKGKRKNKSRKSKGKESEKKAHLSIAMLKKEATKTIAGRRKYMKYLRRHWQPSAKVTKCVELLETFTGVGQKTIIFSQFVSLLDLLQVPIDDKKWKCLRYDGSMSAESRNDAIVKFTESRDHNIMLISLKAGNAGLNLVAASKVIILDPFWNPYIEMQAVDRAYRIGQQNKVEVHRILVEGTVEDRIIQLQEQKRKLVESALDENAAKSMGRLDIRQLAFLFNGNGPAPAAE